MNLYYIMGNFSVCSAVKTHTMPQVLNQEKSYRTALEMIC